MEIMFDIEKSSMACKLLQYGRYSHTLQTCQGLELMGKFQLLAVKT